MSNRNEKRFSAVLVGVVLFALCALPASAQERKTASVPDDVVFEEDIEFANPDNQHLKLDMARPKDGKGPFPSVICIHGGGFVAGTHKSYDSMCVELARRGYVAATVEYRLAPKYPFPACVHDVKAAIRFLRANAVQYNIDPDHIGATGASAGGHLAVFLAVTPGIKQFEGDGGNPETPSRIACAVNFYGPMDFTRIQGRSRSEPVLEPWLGGTITTHRRQHILASPLFWVTPSAVPVLSINGTKDDHVPHEQAAWITERLSTVGVEAELLILPDAGHGFKDEDDRKAKQAMLAFFARHLKGQKADTTQSTRTPKKRRVRTRLSAGERLVQRFDRAAPQIGDPLPDVSAYDADGKPFKLRSLKGHYTVLTFGCLI